MTATPGDRANHPNRPTTTDSDAPGLEVDGRRTRGAREGSSRRPHGAARRGKRRDSRGAHTSLQTAAEAFRMLSTGPAPLALDGAAAGHGLPRRVIPLIEARAMLLHPSTSRAARDAAWRQVITNAHDGSSAWVIGAVGLALPALWKMAGDLAEGYQGETDDLHAAILTGFVAALHHIDTGRPGIITRLRWAAYRAGLLTRYTRQGVLPAPVPIPASAPPPAPWEHPDLLLADAVAKRVLSPLQAELIGRSRLEDITLKEAAAELGVSVHAAYKTRRRGEARLVAAIASGNVEHRVSNPGPEPGLFLTKGTTTQPRRAAPKPGRGRRGNKPAGVRRESTESDGTSATDSTDEKGAFCTPARQPNPTPAPPPPPGQARTRRGTGKRRRGHSRGGGTS